jgi:hypothetical protein
MLILAKTLAKHSFQRVSLYCAGYLFARNRESEPRLATRISSYQDRNTGIATSNIVLKNLLKFERSR